MSTTTPLLGRSDYLEGYAFDGPDPFLRVAASRNDITDAVAEAVPEVGWLRLLDDLEDNVSAAGAELIWRRMPSAAGGGLCLWVGGQVVIHVDPRLDDRGRVDVLAHELGHALDGMPLIGGAHPHLSELIQQRREQHADAFGLHVALTLAERPGRIVVPLSIHEERHVRDGVMREVWS